MVRKNVFVVVLNVLLFLSIVTAWPLHINEKGHNHESGKCFICILITSPQLNSDCGSKLIKRFENFIFILQLFIENLLLKDFYHYSLTRAPPVFI